jgi:outer membrane protein
MIGTALLFLIALPLAAQPVKLTLEEAQTMALRNHPKIAAAGFAEKAAEAVTAQVRAAFRPTITGNVTGARALYATSVASGNITTSSVNSRLSGGLLITQMLSDFGRTASQVKSAREREDAIKENTLATRAQILLRVQQSYFQVMLAQQLRHVGVETVASRQLTLKKVRALFESNLKSSLDLSFAEVSLSEAELLSYRADNGLKAAQAELLAAMGVETEREYELADAPMPGPMSSGPDIEMGQAILQRPDLASLKLQHQAALSFAESEKKLRMPVLTALGVGGFEPLRDDRLKSSYGAAGVNLSVPIFNGNLYAQRRTEADMKALAAEQEVHALQLRIAADVKVAWLNAKNAMERLDLTAKLVTQAGRSLKLSQTRYELGLGSIVELNQALLSFTSAEIERASASYEYMAFRSMLDYQSGKLK